MSARSGLTRIGLRPPASVSAVVSTLSSAFLLVVLSLPAAAQLPPIYTGWITGSVTDAATGAPLAGVSVTFRNAEGLAVGGATTNAGGTYVRVSAPGTYYLCTSNSLGYIDVVYGGDPPVAGCLWAQGKPVRVSAGEITTANFALTRGATITGTVTDAATGARLPGVTVYVHTSSNASVGSATTDASGVYTGGMLGAGTYYLRTSNSAGYVDQRYANLPCASSDCYPYNTGTAVSLTVGQALGGIDFALTLGGTISGTVAAVATGSPLAGVTVYVRNALASAAESTTTNASGVFTRNGLPTGSYAVYTANSQGYADELYDDVVCASGRCANHLGQATPVSVAAGATTSGVNFGLGLAGTIAGTVTDVVSGVPIPDVEVSVHNAAGEGLRSGLTDAAGQYAVAGLPAGTHYVKAAAGGNYISEFYADLPCPSCAQTQGGWIAVPPGGTGVPVTLAATTAGINFALAPGGTVTGIVTDAATGAPLANVTVEASNGEISRSGGTDTSGVYTVRGLVTGTYAVRMQRSEPYVGEVYDNAPCRDRYCYGVAGAGVGVTTSAATSGINFALDRGGTITGRVVNADTGIPLQSVYIRAYRADAGAESARCYTSNSGVFTATGLSAGTYYLVTDASARGYADELYGGTICPLGACTITDGVPVSVTLGGTTSGIDFALSPGGTVTGTVTDAATGLPVDATVNMRLYSSAGAVLGSTNADAAGVYRFSRLPAGTYYARVQFAGDYIRETYRDLPGYGPLPGSATPITVTAAATTSGIDFPLTRGGAVSGTLKAEGTGAPLPGSTVYAVITDGKTVAAASDVTGTDYVLSGLPPGSYYIRTLNQLGYVDEVYHDLPCIECDVTAGQLVTVTGTATAPGVDFVLSPLPDAPNDLCADALEIASTPFTHRVSTARATGAYDDAPQSCGGLGTTMSKSVWYQFTPPATGILTVSAAGSTYDTVISVSTGSCGAFEEIQNGCFVNAAPDPYLGVPSGSGRLRVLLTAGTTYTIQVAAGKGIGGTLNLRVDFRSGAVPIPDFTGDLKSDVLWRDETRGEVWLWPMDGAAKTAESYVRTVGELDWGIRGLGDQNGDWKADVLWRHARTGMVYLWTMDGKDIVAEDIVATVDPAYAIVGTGDYNGDGRSDILWRHLTNGELWVWLMDGATMSSVSYVMTVDPAYAVVGSGDLDGDGKADIVWRHKTRGEVWVWPMNGATPTSMTYVTTVAEAGYQIVGVADHTGDGKADILWWHTTRGEVWLWPMNGTTHASQSYVGMVPDTGYRIAGNGDYNADGKADLLWHHAARGEVWVWLMDGATKISENYVGIVPDVGYQIVKVK